MYCSVNSATLFGVDSLPVCVEADMSQGLPCMEMVGALSPEVKEAKNRVRTALKNTGFALPIKRITVNILPADIKKSGAGFDLPITVALLGAMEMIPESSLKDIYIIGELGLDGGILPISGILPVTLTALEKGMKAIIVPKGNYHEASLVSGIEIIGVSHLNEVISYLVDGTKPEVKDKPIIIKKKSDHDFKDIQGQPLLRRACEIAAAGMHNLLLIGPPGAGKSMVAQCIPTILPDLTDKEKLEVSKIYSVCGLLSEEEGLIESRPFRSPHHTTSSAGLTGGGTNIHPGEISLAHRGVLFLDELPEFQKSTLEILRQPLEDKVVHISRATGNFTFPSDFMLVAAMNPCRCGYFPDMTRCRCTRESVQKYLGKISQPLLDRIDMSVRVRPVGYDELKSPGREESSSSIKKWVMHVQKIQKERFKRSDILFNSKIPSKDINLYCGLKKDEEEFMSEMYKTMGLTARTYHKVLKVARTIADLADKEDISIDHLSEALMYRSADKDYWEKCL